MSRLTGVSYDIKVNAPAGKRIHNLKINGKPLDPNRSYVVSAWGGNLQSAGKNLRESKIEPVYDVVTNYVKKSGKIDVSSKSNVRILDYDCGCPKKGGVC